MSRERANAFLFFVEFLELLHRAMRERRTVVEFVWTGRDGAPDIEFEVRITKLGPLRLPAARKALAADVFDDRFAQVNARSYVKGARRRRAAPDRARKQEK